MRRILLFSKNGQSLPDDPTPRDASPIPITSYDEDADRGRRINLEEQYIAGLNKLYSRTLAQDTLHEE